jgi:hypothetical protein
MPGQGPTPPAHLEVEPIYARVGSSPNFSVSRKGDPAASLKPPGCAFWGDWHSTLLVALAGSLSFNGSG